MTTLWMLVASLQDPETARVTLEARDLPLAKVLEAFRAQTKVPIELNEAAKKQVDLEKEIVQLSFKDIQLVGALRLLFGLHDLDVQIVDKKRILILPK